MLTHRSSLRAALLLCLALLAPACSSSSRPCTTCPNVAGNYDLRFDHGPPAGCTSVSPAQEGVLQVAQQGAALTGFFGGRAVSGTLQDTFDLTLTSGARPAANEQLSLSGRYVPASTDGGAGRILGTLQQLAGASASRDGGSGICSASAAFTATHQ